MRAHPNPDPNPDPDPIPNSNPNPNPNHNPDSNLIAGAVPRGRRQEDLLVQRGQLAQLGPAHPRLHQLVRNPSPSPDPDPNPNPNSNS